jgi:hypothetical protein
MFRVERMDLMAKTILLCPTLGLLLAGLAMAQHGSPAEKAKVRAAVHRKFPSIGKK